MLARSRGEGRPTARGFAHESAARQLRWNVHPAAPHGAHPDPVLAPSASTRGSAQSRERVFATVNQGSALSDHSDILNDLGPIEHRAPSPQIACHQSFGRPLRAAMFSITSRVTSLRTAPVFPEPSGRRGCDGRPGVALVHRERPCRRVARRRGPLARGDRGRRRRSSPHGLIAPEPKDIVHHPS
jgi:hypothetical protein